MKIGQKFAIINAKSPTYVKVVDQNSWMEFVILVDQARFCVDNEGYYKIPLAETLVRLIDPAKPIVDVKAGGFYKDSAGVIWFVRSNQLSNIVAVSVAGTPGVQHSSWTGDSHPFVAQVCATFKEG